MRLYKLRVAGDDDNLVIQYTASEDYITYKDCQFSGSEREKFEQFIEELKKDTGTSPINVKLSMTNRKVDRAIPRNIILRTSDVEGFLQVLDQ